MKNKFRKIAYGSGILMCSIGLIYSAGGLINYYYHASQENKLIEEIQLEKQKYDNDIVTETVEIEGKQILPEYISLYKENNDLYGWIKIPNTTIDYPVMFTPEDPDFYIDKNWEKQVCYNAGSSIFIDGATTEDSENIIVYGHNMKNRTMFGSLKNYKEQSYYEEHKYIEFDTLYERQVFEIISVSKTVVYYEEPPEGEYIFYEHIELDSEEEFDEYINNAKQNAYYDIETTAEYGDQLITLSTCDYWTTDARLIIVAKKVKTY